MRLRMRITIGSSSTSNTLNFSVAATAALLADRAWQPVVPRGQCGFDGVGQRRGVEGLLEECGGALLHGALAQREILAGGDEDDRCGRGAHEILQAPSHQKSVSGRQSD